MAIQSLNQNVAADTVQFALPFFDQMRRCDDKHYLIVGDLPAQFLNDAGSDGNRSGASNQGFADPHLAHQQDAVS